MALIRVVAVTCPRHGEKAGLMRDGLLTPFPFVAEQATVERAQPLCFECRDAGVRRRCVVVMEALGDIE